jgi:hypothetical protein
MGGEVLSPLPFIPPRVAVVRSTGGDRDAPRKFMNVLPPERLCTETALSPLHSEPFLSSCQYQYHAQLHLISRYSDHSSELTMLARLTLLAVLATTIKASLTSSHPRAASSSA